MAPKPAFPERLHDLREQRGLSQEALAKRCGLQPTAISHFETGTRKPSFDNLRRLADALETTVDYLMGRTANTAAPAIEGDQLFRDFQKLTSENREIAREFMAALAKRDKDRKG